MQIRDLAGLVHEAIPEAKITFSEGRIVDSRTYRVDCRKIESLGFRPRWTVRKGLVQLRDAFRATGVSVSDFEGETFQRVGHIKGQIARGALDAQLRRITAKVA